MSITRKLPLKPGDVLLACSDGLWSGLSEEEISLVASRKDQAVGENLKTLSVKALTTNAPYSDNTTGTMLRFLGN